MSTGPGRGEQMCAFSQHGQPRITVAAFVTFAGIDPHSLRYGVREAPRSHTWGDWATQSGRLPRCCSVVGEQGLRHRALLTA
jgi:hypothetical protein